MKGFCVAVQILFAADEAVGFAQSFAIRVCPGRNGRAGRLHERSGGPKGWREATSKPTKRPHAPEAPPTPKEKTSGHAANQGPGKAGAADDRRGPRRRGRRPGRGDPHERGDLSDAQGPRHKLSDPYMRGKAELEGNQR